MIDITLKFATLDEARAALAKLGDQTLPATAPAPTTNVVPMPAVASVPQAAPAPAPAPQAAPAPAPSPVATAPPHRRPEAVLDELRTLTAKLGPRVNEVGTLLANVGVQKFSDLNLEQALQVKAGVQELLS